MRAREKCLRSRRVPPRRRDLILRAIIASPVNSEVLQTEVKRPALGAESINDNEITRSSSVSQAYDPFVVASQLSRQIKCQAEKFYRNSVITEMRCLLLMTL